MPNLVVTERIVLVALVVVAFTSVRLVIVEVELLTNKAPLEFTNIRFDPVAS